MTGGVRAETLPGTLPKLLFRNAEIHAGRPAFREKRSGIWRSWSWAEACAEVQALAAGLQALGVTAGMPVAIVGRNNPRLYWTILASQMLGAIPVPLFPDAPPEEVGRILRHCGAGLAVVENQEQVDKLLSLRDGLPAMRQIVYLSARGLRGYGRDGLHDFGAVLAQGREAGAGTATRLADMARAQDPGDACLLCYTAGTDGDPKGVVLSHQAVIDSAAAAAVLDGLGPGDSVLSCLPIAWIGDFMVSVAQALLCGFSTACPEGPGTATADLRELGPSYMIARPQDFDAIRGAVILRMADAGRLQRWFYRRAMARAARPGRGPGHALWTLLTLAPLRDALGLSRLRLAYAAGGALAPETLAWFRDLGINLKQLYGQTEGALFLTQQRDDAVQAGLSGAPLPGVELRIAADGIVEYRSPGAMTGYFGDDAATGRVRTADGWLRSGDAGRIDSATGQLAILDRAEHVGRLADGTVFAPGAVENRLKAQPHILEAYVAGDGGAFCTAMLNIDPDAVGKWAERGDIVTTSYQELAANPEVHDLLRQEVEAVNRGLAAEPGLAGCQIRRFLVLHKELDPDDGEVTRTGRLRRKVVAGRYANLIEALGGTAREVRAETEVAYDDGRSGIVAATLAIRDAAQVPAASAGAGRQAA
ncbi:MAG: AMP-binding protein [Sneathiellaceae bacterium]